MAEQHFQNPKLMGNDRVSVDIKAIEKLKDVHTAQAINYWEAHKIEDDLLINFDSKSLDFKRVYNKNLVHLYIS